MRVVPSYYPGFRCKAEKCRHTCCAGWEIDVDETSLRRYQAWPGDFGERLKKALSVTREGASFRLDQDERCPMLNPDGLCDLITEGGEGALCQICRDHPRYRNYIGDREEIGLGLCCEAAAELILNSVEPMREICLDPAEDAAFTEDERSLLEIRRVLVSLAQDRTRSMADRILAMRMWGLPLPEPKKAVWIPRLLSLERLDPAWETCLASMGEENCHTDTELEQLVVYLLWRHLPGALEDGRAAERAAFAVLGYALLSRIPGPLTESARMFSSETEYSEENMEQVLRWLAEDMEQTEY